MKDFEGTECAMVAVRGDHGAAEALVTDRGGDGGIGGERFLERVAPLGRFDEIQSAVRST